MEVMTTVKKIFQRIWISLDLQFSISLAVRSTGCFIDLILIDINCNKLCFYPFLSSNSKIHAMRCEKWNFTGWSRL